MDKITFKLTKVKYGIDEIESDAVNIFINGENFLDAIHAYEKFHKINGEHVPITPYELYQSLAEDYLTESVPIYGCICGLIDCCPVYVSISVNENSVTWDNFIFPDEFFSRSHKPRKKFHKLTFDKAQYLDEIEKLKNFSELC